jgi:hypothetical protein
MPAKEMVFMPRKSILVCIAAVVISSVAATYRFGDSGHAVGMLGLGGGKVRHALRLDPDKRQYVLIVTGTVLPPYRGNARVVLEGGPKMNYAVHASGPVVDLGIHHWPRFSDGVLQGLQPKDKFALWVVMQPVDPPESAHGRGPASQQAVAFYDTVTGESLLRVPVIYGPEEETCHAETD